MLASVWIVGWMFFLPDEYQRLGKYIIGGDTARPRSAPDCKKRCRFSAREKQRILSEADRCTEPGQIGALLRREGIYASMLATCAASVRKPRRLRWRRASVGPSLTRRSPRRVR